MLAGRSFTPADDARPARASGDPVVINLALARQLFGDAPALGQTVVIDQRIKLPRVVVGVVGDARTRNLREPPAPMFYEPSGYRYRSATVLVRSTLPMNASAALIKAVVSEVDAALPAGNVTTIGEQRDVLISEERVLARLGLVLAAFAGLLAAAGLAAVVAFQVSERTREFGIRLALGGGPFAVIRSALARAMRASSIGLVVGTIPAILAARLLRDRLFGVESIDPLTWAAAIVLLAATTCVAAWLPARRATQVDPTIALRTD